MRKPIKKKTKIIICVAVLLVVGFFIESLYEAKTFSLNIIRSEIHGFVMN